MQEHKWKTPFEQAVGYPTNLNHVRKIECKAYALDKHIPRKEKLRERAHTWHLIGYDSANNSRVWISSQRKIIRTRDVMFDESSFYKPHQPDPDLVQLIYEPMFDMNVFYTSNLDLTAQISEIESDEEDLVEVNTETRPTITDTPKTGNKSPNNTHLPTLDPTGISLPTSNSFDFELSELAAFTPVPSSIAPRATRFQPH